MSKFLSKEYLFDKLGQENIFSYYFGEEINLLNRYKNPLRTDPSPGCTFYYGKSGDLLLYDSQMGAIDAIKFVMLKYNLSYYLSLIKIKYEFNPINELKIKNEIQEKSQYLVSIKIKKRDFSLKELEYWSLKDLNITQKNLNDYEIYATSHLWFDVNIDGTIVEKYKGSQEEFTFAYSLNTPYQYQIYKPFESKDKKFRCTNVKYIFEETHKEKNYIILNKSRKDNFYAQFTGFNSTGIIAEGLNLDFEFMKELYNTYEKIFIMFDPDEAGRKAVEKAQKTFPFIIPIFAPYGKDLTEMYKLDLPQSIDWLNQQVL